MLFPGEVYARTETLVQIQVRNRRKWMPSFLVTAEVLGGECFFLYIAPNSTVTGYLPLLFEKRGEARIGEVVFSSNFPFNFFTRYRRIRKDLRLTVYPKPLPCALSAFHDSGTMLRGEKELNRLGHDSDILSIRNYVPGDPPKYISWKSTAKTGELKTKELSAVEGRQVTIDLDGMDKSDLERALSCMTYAMLGFMRSGVPVGLRIGGEAFKPGLSETHRKTMLTRLALYGQN
ncbi:MAG: DUF58 domain-containing protein [Syntrophobacteraceae bacterium]